MLWICFRGHDWSLDDSEGLLRWLPWQIGTVFLHNFVVGCYPSKLLIVFQFLLSQFRSRLQLCLGFDRDFKTTSDGLVLLRFITLGRSLALSLIHGGDVGVLLFRFRIRLRWMFGLGVLQDFKIVVFSLVLLVRLGLTEAKPTPLVFRTSWFFAWKFSGITGVWCLGIVCWSSKFALQVGIFVRSVVCIGLLRSFVARIFGSFGRWCFRWCFRCSVVQDKVHSFFRLRFSRGALGYRLLSVIIGRNIGSFFGNWCFGAGSRLIEKLGLGGQNRRLDIVRGGVLLLAASGLYTFIRNCCILLFCRLSCVDSVVAFWSLFCYWQWCRVYRTFGRLTNTLRLTFIGDSSWLVVGCWLFLKLRSICRDVISLCLLSCLVGQGLILDLGLSWFVIKLGLILGLKFSRLIVGLRLILKLRFVYWLVINLRLIIDLVGLWLFLQIKLINWLVIGLQVFLELRSIHRLFISLGLIFGLVGLWLMLDFELGGLVVDLWQFLSRIRLWLVTDHGFVH
ncbi:hypothetical protein HG530_005086 [Fusarium avenaceum]|nr:hypothetical protein HG530_005086 [Fusarium avenaceum]